MDERLQRTAKLLACMLIVGFVVSAIIVIAASAYAQAPAKAGSEIQIQVQDVPYVSDQQKILNEAIEMASDKLVGYSFDSCDRDPDVVCYTFVAHAIVDAGVDGVSDEVLSALEKEGDDESPYLASLPAQVRALTASGYVRHDFSSFDDQDLVPGSVMYACGKSGGIRHVELYLGRYDLDQLDENGNPVADDNGTPMTIGARIDDNDPTPGDQQQAKEGCWLGGEVGAFEGNSRGEDYWTFYYAPSDLRSA